MEKHSSGLFVPSEVARPSTFRKAQPPSLGPAFDHTSLSDANLLLGLPGSTSMMFDVSKLTTADFRSMRWHPQVNASLSMISFMLHQMDWKIESEDKRLAGIVEENMRLIWTRLVRAISQAFWAGYSPCVLEWENTQDGKYTFITKIKDMYPEECQVHWKEVESSYVPPRRQDGFGTNHIVPKVKVFDGIDKYGLGYPIPPEHTFWYPLMMEYGDYSGRKLLKAAFQPWYFSLLMHLYSNRYFERFGEPVPVGRAPFEDDFPVKQADGSTKVITGKQAMEGILMSLRNRGIVVLPSDRDPTASTGGGRSEYEYDIEYLESQMRGADFERYLLRLDEEISLSIFTPMLLMRTGDVGSNALGVQHTQTWLWSLNALAGDIKEYIDRYIVDRIKAVNVSPNAAKVEWVPKKMGKENVETLRAMISGLISQGTVKVDLDELGTALGLTLTEVKLLADPVGVTDDPNAPAQNDIRDRSERVRSGSGKPRGVGEPLATGRQIAARVREQAVKQFANKTLGKADLSMGFRRRFVESLEAEGLAPGEAEQATEVIYSKMSGWLRTASALGVDEFTGADDFVELFQRRLTTEIQKLGLPGE